MGKKNILRMSTMLQAALLSTVIVAAVAEAQEGLYLGAEMVFAGIGGKTNSGVSLSPGNGGGITGGYGISRNIAVEASFWSTGHDASDGRTIYLQATLLGVKAVFPLAHSHIEPYVMLGIGKYRLDEIRGEGWLYGAGMDISLVSSMRLTIGIARHAVDFGAAPRESEDITSMSAGISFQFI
jgi:hypothetical protein